MPTGLLVVTVFRPITRLQVQMQQIIRGTRWLTPTEPVEENRNFVVLKCVVKLVPLNTPPMPARVLLKPLLTVIIEAPLFPRAITRPLRTVSMLPPGQNMTTCAPGILVNLLSVVPLALLEAVARTMTLPASLPPPVEAATKQGRTERVTLPKVTAGLRNNLRQRPLLVPINGMTSELLNPLLQVVPM